MKRRTIVSSALTLAAASLIPLRRAFSAGTASSGDIPAIRGDGKDTVLTKAEVQEFAASVRGGVLLPGANGYDAARRLWNSAFDRHPALIARCTAAEDVVHAVNFARTHSLLTAVRGGGHSISGQSACDGGLMIDLSLMNGIHIDSKLKRARIEPGVLLGEFDRQAQAVGLVTTTGTVTHTGVAGLTLGGGMGRLARKFGLACDNVLAVDIVTANGKLVTANERENRDLFWAVRGGGGNFGIVTAFEFQLHEQDRTVLGGAMLFPFTNARATLASLAEFAEGAPDEMYISPAVVNTPQGRVVGFELCYSGPPAEGERLIAPLRRLGKPVLEKVSAMPYLAVQASSDLPPGRNYYFKSGFVTRVDAKLIDEIVRRFEAAPPSLQSIPLIHIGGAVGRVKPDATPFWNRDAQHDLAVWAGWNERSESEKNVAAIRDVWRSFEPLTKGYYINTDTPDDERRLKLTYGDNYARLVRIKNTYDPTNLFRLNANIRPTVAGT